MIEEGEVIVPIEVRRKKTFLDTCSALSRKNKRYKNRQRGLKHFGKEQW